MIAYGVLLVPVTFGRRFERSVFARFSGRTFLPPSVSIETVTGTILVQSSVVAETDDDVALPGNIGPYAVTT